MGPEHPGQPATYEVTGIQTFIVNQDGIVYQKDLGPNTAQLAAAIRSYNPDKTWIETDDAMEEEDSSAAPSPTAAGAYSRAGPMSTAIAAHLP